MAEERSRRTERLLAALYTVGCLLPGCGERVGEAPTTPQPEAADGDRCGDGRCGAGEAVRSCPVDCLELDWVLIEGGGFKMGRARGPLNEGPVHEVTLSSFELMRREVTLDEYRHCVDTGACSEPRFERDNELVSPRYCTWLAEDRGDHPIR